MGKRGVERNLAAIGDADNMRFLYVSAAGRGLPGLHMWQTFPIPNGFDRSHAGRTVCCGSVAQRRGTAHPTCGYRRYRHATKARDDPPLRLHSKVRLTAHRRKPAVDVCSDIKGLLFTHLSNSSFIRLKIRIDVYIALSYRYLLHVRDGIDQR